jgi:hypothetical protein
MFGRNRRGGLRRQWLEYVRVHRVRFHLQKLPENSFTTQQDYLDLALLPQPCFAVYISKRTLCKTLIADFGYPSPPFPR